MEDVLETYSRDFDTDEVLVCLDETSRQQTKETRTPLPTRPGQPAAYDFEYERNGTANLFMLCAPLIGWRHVEVTDRRTRQDFAAILRDLADGHFPEKKITLIMDNLNTHKLSTLSDTFAPARTIQRGQADRGSLRGPLYAETRLLAQYRRNRDQCPVSSMPRATHSRPGDIDAGGACMAGSAQRRHKTRRLAVHSRRRPHQTEIPLSINTMMLVY